MRAEEVSTSTPLLRLTAVSKSFGAVRALRGVSLELWRGEVHALLGENGAGKSTLIRVITGAHRPDAGRIEIEGRVVTHFHPGAAHRLGITCIYQQPALFPDLTVEENIALRLEPTAPWRRVRWAERRARAGDLLGRIGAAIDPVAEVRALSMPEQQLVEIACALGAGAKVVIMDEPTASLTQREQALLFGVVRELRASGVGVIYISHRLEEILELADRVTVLRDGESVGTRWVRGGGVAMGAEVGAGQPTDDRRAFPGDSEGNAAGRAAGGLLVGQAELIRMMVGREVSQIYPPSEGKAGAVVLSLCGVSCAALGVREVNLELRAGEVLGVAGLVGAGRTELARMLFGIEPWDAGEVRLDGRVVRIEDPAQAIALGLAYLPEDRRRHGIVLEMTLAQNLSMAVHRRLFPWGWLRFGVERAEALRWMDQLGVKASGPESIGAALSGGNQQKVALGRWLATRPRVLILDEPTQGVDVGAKAEIHRMIRQLVREGVAVMMISSDLPEVLGMSDRIAVMRGGTVSVVLPGGSDAHTVMAAALGQLSPGVAAVGKELGGAGSEGAGEGGAA